MARRSRRSARSLGIREANAIAATLGRELRITRRQRRLRQDELGDAAGVSQSEISNLEAGRGAHTSIETWVALGLALDRPIAIGFSRDVATPLSDAGHLAAQELLIRTARAAGWRATFEVPADPSRSGLTTDIVLEREVVVLVEIWNRLDDLGAAARSTDRKLTIVAAARGDRATRSVWLLLDTHANRTIVAAFPAILRSRFPGSSGGWVEALTTGSVPPREPGLAWTDLRAGRLHGLRLRGSQGRV
jgi:transcriptional regulator with XRE-family HTH domain